MTRDRKPGRQKQGAYDGEAPGSKQQGTQEAQEGDPSEAECGTAIGEERRAQSDKKLMGAQAALAQAPASRAFPSRPSAALCRAQEQHHRDRAACAELDNVRRISMDAAAAWAVEAIAAERREDRHRRTIAVMEGAVIEPLSHECGDDRIFSENPDRGMANA